MKNNFSTESAVYVRNQSSIEKWLVFFVTFFSFSGFYAGLALVIAAGHIELSRFYSIPIRLLLSAAMVWVILSNIGGLLRLRKPLMLLAVLFFWVLFSFNVFANFEGQDYRLVWWEYILYAVNFCILPFLMYASISFDRYADVISRALIYSGVLLGLCTVVLYGPLLVAGIGRISMLKYSDDSIGFLSPLALSYSASLSVCVGVTYLLFGRPSRFFKFLICCGFLFSLVMFYLGASRGSVVSMVFTFLIIIWYARVKSRVWILLSLVVSLPLILLGAEVTGSGVFERLLNTREAIEYGDSSAARLFLWTTALEYISANPLFGGFLEVDGSYPHNFILEVLMITGLIGGAMLLIPLLALMARAFNNARYRSMVLPLVLLVQGVIQHSFSGSVSNAILIFMPMGIILSTWTVRGSLSDSFKEGS